MGAEAEVLSSPRTWSSTPRRRTMRTRCPPPGLASATATLASDLTGKAADATGCPPTFADALSQGGILKFQDLEIQRDLSQRQPEMIPWQLIFGEMSKLIPRKLIFKRKVQKGPTAIHRKN